MMILYLCIAVVDDTLADADASSGVVFWHNGWFGVQVRCINKQVLMRLKSQTYRADLIASTATAS